jgi:hypothetical protein
VVVVEVDEDAVAVDVDVDVDDDDDDDDDVHVEDEDEDELRRVSGCGSEYVGVGMEGWMLADVLGDDWWASFCGTCGRFLLAWSEGR